MWQYLILKDQHRHNNLQQQLQELLFPLAESESKRFVKICIFTALPDRQACQQALLAARKAVEAVLPWPLVISVIPQRPADCQVAVEAWYTGPQATSYHQAEGEEAICLKQDGLLLARVASFTGDVYTDAINCFSAIEKLGEYYGFLFRGLFRQWNYIGQIFEFTGGRQHYQLFNDARGQFFTPERFPQGYPAATGIGMDVPGVIIESCFIRPGRLRSLPLANPMQRPAHQYSQQVLHPGRQAKAAIAPRFERARILADHTGFTTYVSGTAAIKGEVSLHQLNATEQARQTLELISSLVAPENVAAHWPEMPPTARAAYKSARVYLKEGGPSPDLRQLVEGFFKTPHLLYLLADVCRDNLLVEIEAEQESRVGSGL